MFNPAFLEIGIAKPNTPNRDASDKALGFTRFLEFQGMFGVQNAAKSLRF